jgi:hypothetical protein
LVSINSFARGRPDMIIGPWQISTKEAAGSRQ